MSVDDVKLRAIRAAFARHAPVTVPDIRPSSERVDAAVLVPLSLGDDPSIAMHVRAHHLRNHAGEVGFPGGSPDLSDRDLAHTALREAHEEFGLDPNAVELIGTLSPMPVATSRFRIHPFVGLVPGACEWKPSKEVDRVLDLPLRSFANGTFKSRAARIHWGGVEILAPFFVLDERTTLYGATAYIVVELFSLIGGPLGMELPVPEVGGQAPWQSTAR